MRRHHILLIGIIGLGALLRFALLPFIAYPGINDPNHYYNLGVRLLNGHGFTLDYLWHFSNAPADLMHPFDFWQPLTGVVTAGGLWLFGETYTGAIIPFIILGSLLPLIAYFTAKQLQCSETASLFATLATALLPELVINSLRTDTLIPNALFVGLMFVGFVQGMRTGKLSAFVIAGISAGLAYLTRGDNLLLLPMLIVSLTIFALFGRKSYVNEQSWRWVWLIPVIGLVISAPWIMRNLSEFGHWSSAPGFTQMMYYSEFNDHYHYEREFSLETLLDAQTVTQLINKRIFEAAAAIRMMITTLDIVLPLGVLGGVFILMMRRDWDRLLTLMPPSVLLGGMFFSYVVLVPIANQGGSYKKAYLTLVPLLIPLASVAIDYVIKDENHKRWLTVLAGLLMLQSSIMFVVEDIRFTGRYLTFLAQVDTALASAPDTNGDGKIVIMAQDPFAIRTLGYQAVQIPAEDRDTIVEVAERYDVDYILFPPARPALDGIYNLTETDPRFVWAIDVNLSSQLYRIGTND